MAELLLSLTSARWLTLSAVAFLVAPTSCTSDNGEDGPFCRARPTFRVWLTALEAAVPQGTKLTVEYGAGSESYELGGANPIPRALFCTPLTNDGGALAADASADAATASGEKLVCDLYTEGAATITVVAEGYTQIKRELQAKRDPCGIATVEVLLTLDAADAAP